MLIFFLSYIKKKVKRINKIKFKIIGRVIFDIFDTNPPVYLPNYL